MSSDLRTRAEALRWYHTIDLGHGVVTQGVDDSPIRLARLDLPASFTGQTVLDVGAWDGFFSFEAERRGAARVVAADYYSWHGGGWGSKAGFELARTSLGSKVEDVDIDVMDLSPERVGTFDVVFFLGVLYHLKNPQRALEHVASVTGDLLILETHVDLLHLDRPAVAFYPGEELDGDATNWCGPNFSALEWMLRDVGFQDLRRVFESPRWWRSGRAVKLALRGDASFLRAYRQGRVVYHARKGR